MSTYHPLYSGLWNDDHLEGLPFEGKAFFAYLWSNDRVRPSGIYRVTDGQLAADTGLLPKRIAGYLDELSRRGRIVRDGAWIFVRGYFKRQPKQDRLLGGVRADVEQCSSQPILEAFRLKYPVYDKWSTDRLLTLTRPSPDGQQPVERLCLDRAVQSSTEQSSTEQSRSISPPPPPAAPAPPRTQFRVPTSISEALDRAPKLGADPRIRTPAYWQALVRAHGGVNYGHEILKAEAWMVSNPAKAPRKNLARFLASWIGRAEPPDEEVT